MIGIVDTGGANHNSIRNALTRLGHSSQISADWEFLDSCSHLILPGVGHARFAMERLDAHNLVGFLREQRRPILGICLGMQLLFSSSEEGDVECLRVLPGRVTKMEARRDFRVPHMGWSRVTARKNDSILLKDIAPETYFYFVHSFRVPDGSWTRSDTAPGLPATVEFRNFIGAQFHPERSGDAGALLLKNFLAMRPFGDRL